MSKSIFLKTAIKAIKASERIIMQNYNSLSGLHIKIKNDSSIVTDVDILAENCIRDIISIIFPEHGFLGEEIKSKKNKSKFLWIIDPIDGTKNFVRGIPFFATQIALINGEDFILGVSNAPALKELIYAEKKGGAYCNGKRITVSEVKELEDAYLSFGNVKHFNNLNFSSRLNELIKKVKNPRGIGDAISYHLLSQGKIDIMIDAYTKIWDIAAFVPILEEAGGVITDINGSKISLESSSVIATNKLLYQSVASIFK